MTYRRITDINLETHFLTQAATAKILGCTDGAVVTKLKALGVSMVNVAGKPMVYRHEVMEALERRDRQQQPAQQAQPQPQPAQA